MTFFCRAVEIPKKSVEQLRFEQMDFDPDSFAFDIQLILFYSNYSNLARTFFYNKLGLGIYKRL